MQTTTRSYDRSPKSRFPVRRVPAKRATQQPAKSAELEGFERALRKTAPGRDVLTYLDRVFYAKLAVQAARLGLGMAGDSVKRERAAYLHAEQAAQRTNAPDEKLKLYRESQRAYCALSDAEANRKRWQGEVAKALREGQGAAACLEAAALRL